MMRISALSCFITVAAFAHTIEAFEIHQSTCSKHSKLGSCDSDRYLYHVLDTPLNPSGGRRFLPLATTGPSKSMQANFPFGKFHLSKSSSQLSMIKNDESQQKPDNNNENLDKFRSLMGTLYGIAGIAHAIDCYLGPSQLLVAAGNLPFHELPIVGQAMATIWCISGPFAFVLSRQAGSGTGAIAIADVGLITYGVVEVGVAAFSPDSSTVVNASLVQGVVLAAWLYSRQKSD